MLRILADDHNAALAPDNLALFAHGLNGRSDFHLEFLLMESRDSLSTFASNQISLPEESSYI